MNNEENIVCCSECDADITEGTSHNYDLETCDECIESKFVECCDCNEAYPESDAIERGGDYRCEDCYWERFSTCYECSDDLETEDGYHSEDGDFYCDNCYYEIYTLCDDCGCEVDRDHACWTDNGAYCDRCYETNYQCDLNSYGSVRIHNSQSFFANRWRRGVGVEIEACNDYQDEMDSDVYFSNYDYKENWRCVHDGSINPNDDGMGREFITRGGLIGDALYNTIDNMTDMLRKRDWYVNRSCGLHVHIDARDLEWRQLKYVLLVGKLCENVLYKMVPPSRSKSSWARRIPMSYHNINAIHDEDSFIDSWYSSHDAHPSMEKYNDSRYCGINMHSRVIHGSIEFRHHSGTLNADKIKHWIEICQSIVALGVKLSHVDHDLIWHKRVNIKDKKVYLLYEFIKRLARSDNDSEAFDLWNFVYHLELKEDTKNHLIERLENFRSSYPEKEFEAIGFHRRHYL